METIISEQQLKDYLEIIKEVLTEFDLSALKNVVFISPESVFSYLNTLPLPVAEFQNIEALLDRIERYIPCVLSDNNYYDLIMSYLSESEEEQESCNYKIKARTYIDFIAIVRNIENEEDWHNIVDLCQNIRKIREEQREKIFV